MIRVNLLRNRVQDSAGGSPVEAAPVSTGETRDTVIKILFISLFTIGLMLYENQNLDQKSAERAKLESDVAEMETKTQAVVGQLGGIKDIAKEAEELQVKLKVLKLLSRLRLREVKTMDFMQSSIPEKLWVRSVIFESDEKIAEKARYQFVGNAVTTEDITDFVKKLEDSAYMEEVIVIKNQEIAGPGRTGNLRDFQFTAEVETKN